jgi:hypothetical protein
MANWIEVVDSFVTGTLGVRANAGLDTVVVTAVVTVVASAHIIVWDRIRTCHWGMRAAQLCIARHGVRLVTSDTIAQRVVTSALTHCGGGGAGGRSASLIGPGPACMLPDLLLEAAVVH